MRRTITQLLWLICWLSGVTASAQQIRFENYTTRNGLLSDHVYNMYEDSKGYLWIFTEYGTQKFNGREFTRILKNLPHKDSFMFCFYERPDGRIWVANSRGRIYEVINDSAFLVPGTEKYGEVLRRYVSEIYILHVDDSLNIYAVSKRHTVKYVKNKSEYVPVDLGILSGDTLSNLFIPLGKTLLPVNVYNPEREKNSSLPIKIGILSRPASTLTLPGRLENLKYAREINGSIYLSFVRHIVKWNDTAVHVLDLKNYLLHLTVNRRGNIFAACYVGGLIELDQDLNILNRYLKGIPCNDVLADSQNGLWVSSAGRGLFHCSNTDRLHYPPGSPFGSPITFVKRVGNDLYVGSSQGEVYKQSDTDFVKIKTRGRSEAMDIVIWNGRQIIVRKHEIAGFVFRDSEVSNGLELIPLSPDTLVDVIRRGIVLFTKKPEVKIMYFPAKVNTGAAGKGRILLGTDDGPFEVRDTLLVLPPELSRLANTSITKFRRHDGWLWICTAGAGLFKFSDDTLLRLRLPESLAGDVINNISFYRGFALLCTSKGLFKLLLKDSSDQLSSETLYTGTVTHAEARNEKIYLATPEGLVVVPWNQTNLNPLKASLVSVLHNTRPVLSKSFDSILTDGDLLEIQFDVIAFDQPRALQYTVAGPFSDSGRVLDGRIKLPNLKAGSYRLSVWPDKEGSVKRTFLFSVAKAWWQRPWFYVTCMTALALFAFGIGWLVFTLKKKRMELRTRLERRILEYKFVALKAQINPHFLSNCLTAIQQLIYDNKVRQANLYIANFGLLIRKILIYSEKSFISLEEEIELAKLSIELELLRFENKFKYLVEMSGDIMPKDISVPPLLINPIIENAIWHGLLPLGNRRPGLLTIRCSQKDEKLYIVVEDNGVGRTKRQGANEGHEHRQSKGLSIITQRLENINQLYECTLAGMEIEDLFNENGEPFGIRVTICIPENFEKAE